MANGGESLICAQMPDIAAVPCQLRVQIRELLPEGASLRRAKDGWLFSSDALFRLAQAAPGAISPSARRAGGDAISPAGSSEGEFSHLCGALVQSPDAANAAACPQVFRRCRWRGAFSLLDGFWECGRCPRPADGARFSLHSMGSDGARRSPHLADGDGAGRSSCSADTDGAGRFLVWQAQAMSARRLRTAVRIPLPGRALCPPGRASMRCPRRSLGRDSKAPPLPGCC